MQGAIRPEGSQVYRHAAADPERELSPAGLVHWPVTEQQYIGVKILAALFKNASQGGAATLFFTVQKQLDPYVGHSAGCDQGVNGGHQRNHRCLVIAR